MSGIIYVMFVVTGEFLFYQVAWYPLTQLDEKDHHRETETSPSCWRYYYWKDD